MLTFFSVCFIQILFSEYCCEMASVTRHRRHLLLVRYYWGIQQMMLIRQSHKRAKVSQAIRFSCRNVPLFVSLLIRFVVIFYGVLSSFNFNFFKRNWPQKPRDGTMVLLPSSFGKINHRKNYVANERRIQLTSCELWNNHESEMWLDIICLRVVRIFQMFSSDRATSALLSSEFEDDRFNS